MPCYIWCYSIAVFFLFCKKMYLTIVSIPLWLFLVCFEDTDSGTTDAVINTNYSHTSIYTENAPRRERFAVFICSCIKTLECYYSIRMPSRHHTRSLRRLASISTSCESTSLPQWLTNEDRSPSE